MEKNKNSHAATAQQYIDDYVCRVCGSDLKISHNEETIKLKCSNEKCIGGGYAYFGKTAIHVLNIQQRKF